MSSLWDDIAKTIRVSVETVVEKTEEFTKIGKIKVEIINTKRNMDKNFSHLGGKVYHLISEDKQGQIVGNKEIKEIVKQIKVLEVKLDEKKSELEKVKKKDNTVKKTKVEVVAKKKEEAKEPEIVA